MLMGCYIINIYINYVLLNETSLSKKLESKNNRNIHQKSCSMVGSVQLLRLGAIYANVSPIPNKGWSTVKDSLLPRGKVWSLDFLSMASSSNQWQVDHIVPITRTIFKMTSKLDEIPPKKGGFSKMPTKNFKKPAGAIHDLRFEEPLSQVCSPPKSQIPHSAKCTFFAS